MKYLDRFPSKPLFQVQLIIRSPGLAYALNDFLEVISHLRREYNVTRTDRGTEGQTMTDVFSTKSGQIMSTPMIDCLEMP